MYHKNLLIHHFDMFDLHTNQFKRKVCKTFAIAQKLQNKIFLQRILIEEQTNYDESFEYSPNSLIVRM
jgi:hypothetical protein